MVPSTVWGPNQWLVAQADQRHLLQLACTDRLLGKFLRRLRALGIYDRSVIVVTADQGVSVQAGQSRRSVDPEHPTTLADLAFVPLFFKRPGQQHGAVVDTHVRTLDIGATIADVLDIKIPWRVDGRSFFRPGHSPEVNFLTGRGWAHADVHALARQRANTVRRKAALFGGGLLRVGPHPELLGRRVSTVHVMPAAARASIDGQVAALLRSLPADSEIQPAQMMGSIRGPGAAENRQLAVAVNGRLAAVTYTYREGSTVRYSAMAPESAFHPGRNDVGLYWIAQTRGTLALESLGP
jgi:Sulfatase